MALIWRGEIGKAVGYFPSSLLFFLMQLPILNLTINFICQKTSWGLGPVLWSLGCVLVRLGSILGGGGAVLEHGSREVLTSWTVLEGSSKLFRVWEQILIDFGVIFSLRLGVISLAWEGSKL